MIKFQFKKILIKKWKLNPQKKTLKTIKVKYNQISDLNLNYIEKKLLFQILPYFFINW